jgi:DNA (cytosine-5)-methyltransferase 1
MMQSVEIFTGAGGLALGIARAGFNHCLAVECNFSACKTLFLNQDQIFTQNNLPYIFQAKVEEFDFSLIDKKVDLLAGGPPCQPFSHGGLHQGLLDKRDMFPQFVRAVRELKPKIFIVENVKGLLRKSFAKYFEYIILQLTYPEMVIKTGETWIEHLSRLEQYNIKGMHKGLFYKVLFRLLNAADYGVPQRRERVFIVGIRSDINLQWSFPQPTHCQETLLWSQWVTGEYWEQYKIRKPEPPEKLVSKIKKLQSRLLTPEKQRWLTVRDAIHDLPDPTQIKTQNICNHWFVPGAKAYPGHTGSPVDEPAKTLKAGVHGVPGGENMIRFSNGTVRYFTIREAARLQTFPDTYTFFGSWTEAMRQLGNAVPVTLSEKIACCLLNRLSKVS